MTMDIKSLIEKSQIGKWMKQSGKTLDDLDKYEKYEYEQTIKDINRAIKQRDMVANATPREGNIPCRHQFREENAYHIMPEILDKIIDLGLDIGSPNSQFIYQLFPDNDEDLKPGFNNGPLESSQRKAKCATSTFTYNHLWCVEWTEQIRDVNTELICLKEDFKLEIERNKTLQDKNEFDINNLLSRIEKQEEKNNKQTEMINILTTSIKTNEENIKNMIIYNRIVIGLMMIVYITFEFYKNYNFESREDVCQVK